MVFLFYTEMQWRRQNKDETLNSQNTLHISPVSYEGSIVSILEEMDSVITAPYCNKHKNSHEGLTYFALLVYIYIYICFIYPNKFDNDPW